MGTVLFNGESKPNTSGCMTGVTAVDVFVERAGIFCTLQNDSKTPKEKHKLTRLVGWSLSISFLNYV